MGAKLLPQSYQYPNLSEGADRVAGQLRRDKECPFSGVTKSGRVWRKVPESDAQSVGVAASSKTGSIPEAGYPAQSSVAVRTGRWTWTVIPNPLFPFFSFCIVAALRRP